ncbi:MAG: hypothetical protein JRI68_11090 [Deltaproteobacteria bacterium]|nr:hypothetical protein [Deltaproteobacteria bacterium]
MLSLLCWMPSHAWAQPDASIEQRKDEAKAIANSAHELMGNGLYAEAIELFKKADARFHSPVFLLFISKAEASQGHLLASREWLQTVIDEQLADYAPDAFREAKDEARRRQAKLDRQIPTVTLSVVGSAADLAEVQLDGRPVAQSDLASPMQLDPGEHQATARAPDGSSDERSFTVKAGEQTSVELVLTSSIDVEPGPGPPPPPDPDEEGGRSWLLPGIAFGVGGAGLLMGVIAGAIFTGQAGDLKDACEHDGDGDENTCPADKEEDGDTVTMLGNVSTAGFVIAGVGIAAGVVLLLVPGDEEDEDPAAAYEPQIHVGPTGFVIEGTF